MKNILISQAVSLILAITPLSYLLITKLGKFFSSHLHKLGATTVICTTVAGILTRKNPVIKTFYFDKHEILIEEENGFDKKFIANDPSVEMIGIVTSFCHYAKLKELENTVLNFLKICGLKLSEIIENYKTIQEIPLNKEKKITTVVVMQKSSEDIFALNKGNPKSILDRCTRIIIDNKKVDLTVEKKRSIKRKIEKLNKRGQKLLAFAYKGLPKKILDNYTEDFTQNDLIFLGLVGLNDEINWSQKDIIEKTKAANIKIYVTSGLKEKKTLHAATELKIINTHYFETISGEDLRDIDDRKLQKILTNKEKDYVFCELSEKDKRRIVENLENNGETVSLISQKTPLTFEEILHSIKLLKEKTKNYNKIKYHRITYGIGVAAVTFSAIIFQNYPPLSFAVILLTDLIINLTLELAIREHTNSEETHNKNSVIPTGIFIGLLFIFVYILNLLRFGWYPGETLEVNSEIFLKSATMLLVLSIIFQVTNAYLHLKKPFKNIYLTLSTVVCLLVIYGFTHIEFIQKSLHLSQIGSLEWQIIAFSVILLIAFEEIRKYLNRPKLNENLNPPL